MAYVRQRRKQLILSCLNCPCHTLRRGNKGHIGAYESCPRQLSLVIRSLRSISTAIRDHRANCTAGSAVATGHFGVRQAIEEFKWLRATGIQANPSSVAVKWESMRNCGTASRGRIREGTIKLDWRQCSETKTVDEFAGRRSRMLSWITPMGSGHWRGCSAYSALQ
jgi:hypothetical protein